MLTETQVQRVARLAALAPYLDREQLEGLLKLIRDLKEAEGQGAMPGSAIQQMVDVIDDKTMAAIVEEQRHRPVPGWLPPSPSRKEERKGPPKEIPLEPPSGIRYVDEIADHFAALDRLQAAKQIADALGAVKPKG